MTSFCSYVFFLPENVNGADISNGKNHKNSSSGKGRHKNDGDAMMAQQQSNNDRSNSNVKVTNSFMQEIQSVWFAGVCKKWKHTFGFVQGK
jgi:carotenoid cleavage dioxygenase-like enzyme